MTRTRAALFGLAFFTTAHLAYADPLDKDADAERLFREGQKLMEERRYGEACPKFDLAYRKDQQLGTLLNLAYCHKELGTTWLAWVEFKEAELKAIELKRTERRDFARQRMAEL
jgi:tetratricopeptide (TPR) repeat protein